MLCKKRMYNVHIQHILPSDNILPFLLSLSFFYALASAIVVKLLQFEASLVEVKILQICSIYCMFVSSGM